MLEKNPGVTIVAILTLALGIGANTAIFTVAYATLLAPLPYPHSDRLVNIWSSLQGHRDSVSTADFFDWRRQSTAFEELTIWSPADCNIATPERPEDIEGMKATEAYPRMLGNPLFLGRNFLPEEGEPGKEHVVILSYRLWRRFGANAKIIGQTMQINLEPYTVVGVLAPGTADRWDWELIVPLVFKPEEITHESDNWFVTGRLKPNVTVKQAQAEMEAITASEAKDYPKTNQGRGAIVEPFKNDNFPGDRQLALWLLLGAVGFLLLIACLNVTNLLLAKGITRQREVAVRSSLGAQPAVIFAQFLTESVVLATLGGLLGIVAGYAMLRGLVAVIPAHALPAEADLRLNAPVLLIMFAAATLAGVLFGCAPAWYASRLDLAEVLKEGGRLGIGAGRHRLRRILVIAEFALALPLLAGTGLAIHSFWNLTRVDLGFRTDHILGFYVDPPPWKDLNQTRMTAYYRSILAGIAAVPGVSHVSVMAHLPLDTFHFLWPFTVAGKSEYANASLRPSAYIQTITPDYFQTLGIRIVKGRGFTDADNASSVRVAMVDEAFASRFLKGVDPLQQRVVMELPIAGEPKNGPAVKTAEDPASMTKSVVAAVNTVDPQAATDEPRTIEQMHDAMLANDRFTVILFAGFAVVGLLLAAVGIHGVTAFSVAQRSHEIAVRMALGATRNRVVALVVKEGLVLACIGLSLGLVGAYFLGRAMQSILFGIGTIDFLTLDGVGAILLLTAFLACYLPTQRATRSDPMVALRHE
jgi:putative ABC transport system permease protein